MKKLVALVATITLASTSVVACTPKPVSAEPVAEEFLQGMESRNNDGLAALTDAPSDATDETVPLAEALAFTFASAGIAAVLKVVGQRSAASGVRKIADKTGRRVDNEV